MDHLGRDVPLARPPRRLVSLVPSITESVVELGGTLVGRTEWCPDVPGARACGGTKTPDVAAILALEPDLVLANKEENREEDVAAIAARVPVFVTDVRTVAAAIAWVDELREILAGAWSGPPCRTAPPASRAEARKGARHVALVWKQRDTLTAVGEDTYAADVLRACGLTNVVTDRSVRYPRLSLDELAALRPALVVLPGEPYPWKLAEAEELERELARRGATARAIRVSGEALTWWGVRTARALVELGGALS